MRTELLIIQIILSVIQFIIALILFATTRGRLKLKNKENSEVDYLIKIVADLYKLSNNRDLLSLCSLKALYKLLEDKGILSEEDFKKYSQYQEDFYNELNKTKDE